MSRPKIPQYMAICLVMASCSVGGEDSVAPELDDGSLSGTRSGLREQGTVRDPIIFNWRFYLDAYPGLRRLGIRTKKAASTHWQENGIKECRRGAATFFAADYLRLNPDVEAKVGQGNCEGAINHYLASGRYSNRRTVQPWTYGWSDGPFGDSTFGNELITFHTTAGYAGAVTEVWYKGKQYENYSDTGRLFQTALTFDGHGECFNPTEAGARLDAYFHKGTFHGRSQSILRAIKTSPGELRTTTTPAYWFTPGAGTQYCGTPQGNEATAPERISKKITMNFLGDRHMVLWETHVDVAANHAKLFLEGLTGYQTGEFVNFQAFNPATGRLVPTTSGNFVFEGDDPKLVGDWRGVFPLVVSTQDEQYAIGVVAIDQGHSDSPGLGTQVPRYLKLAYLDPHDADQSTTKWSVWFSYQDGATKGRYTSRIALIFGTTNEVTERMRGLHKRFSSHLTLSLLAQDTSGSGLDVPYYLANNPGLVAPDNGTARVSDSAVLEAVVEHYLFNGLTAGQSGSPHFNAKRYLTRYPDLQAALGATNVIGALKHYLTIGRHEGRQGM